MKHLGYTMGISLLIIALLSGCGNKEQDLTVKQPVDAGSGTHSVQPVPTANKPEEVLKLFELRVAQAKEARVVIAFMDEHIKKVDSQTADKMFLVLEQFYEQHLPALNANFATMLAQPETAENMRELGYPVDFNNIKNDDSLKQWLTNQVTGKLVLDDKEGDLFWRVNYEALQIYGASLSDDLNEYLKIRAEESKKNFYRDGSLKISRDELAERIMLTEQYITKYPEGKRKTEIKALYKQYLVPYIQEYTYEAVDENTMKLLPEVKQSYESLIKQHPDSQTAQIVKAYLDLINQNQDVIYSQGTDSIFGEPKANIANFWTELNGKVNALF
ncbi:helix-turn-helix domain-containing protein [Paenibacillus eucommiae]|uniref:Transcriptional regulator with XRE-family HTH domain n=1 Tax=Paenibacillus eucommiae TaxID=1355755 RepID=A0ABS4ISM5_9BACL|nr:helix-turn-helix transcriptional regulator [Paenibacillus eucommiae]MBP1990016.1 transcriptional regulator with XRE-family HTH domain [Paenibacillus eucommiae]